MLYLHSHNIIHRDLILRHIFLDDLLYPKITGFNFPIEHTENLSKGQISKGIYRTKNYEYIATEILSKLEYSKSSDVYAFSIVLYQILTGKEPYPNLFFNDIMDFVLKQKKRPIIEETMCNKAYKNLIERCWSQDPKSRPSFSEIVNELEKNFDFITPNINDEEYRRYIKFIKESPISFNEKKIQVEINCFNKNEIINFTRKLNIISQINHPSIISFVGFSSIDFNNKIKPVILTEYLPFLDVLDRRLQDDTKILIIVYGIASAMSYLHSNNILHRDLKILDP